MSLRWGGKSKCRPLMAVLLIAGLMMGTWAAWPSPAIAAPEDGIGIRAEIGLAGVVKESRWTRLRITVTNGTGKELSGELQFTMIQPNGGYNQQFASEAQLPAGSPVVIEMTVPGIPYNKNNNRIRFVQTKGADQVVPITEGAAYVDTFTQNDTLIGVVARDPDTFNFMPLLNQQGHRLKVQPISPDELPRRALQLDGLDMLLLNDTATGSWSGERVRAIRGWVQQGGTLIVAGGAGYAKTAEAFADLVPLAAEGTSQWNNPDKLTEWGDQKALDAAAAVTVSTGKLQAGQIILADAGQILAASRTFGSGQVVYAAFDPSLAPLAAWAGSPALWSRILVGTLGQPANQMAGAAFGYGNGFWELDNAINQFPSIKQPPIGMLVLFFALYILVVAPVLFLILRAFDRREWAWWIIPIVSIACSFVIFNVGAADKNQMLAHSLRTVELAGNGEAVRSATVGVFVPKGGNVRAAFESDATLMPYPDSSGGGTGNVDANETMQGVRMNGEAATAVWRDVPYWSVRKAWLQYEASPGHGQFTVSAKSVSASHLELAIRNDTPTDLTNVSIVTGGAAFPVGDLKAGESGSVALPAADLSSIYAGWNDYGGFVFPRGAGQGDPYSRERGLLNGYMNGEGRDLDERKPLIVGFSKDQTSWFTVQGKQAKSDNLTLWVQPLDGLAAAGKDAILPGMVQPVVTKLEMQSLGRDYPSNRLNLSQGSLEFEYPLPVLQDGSSGLASGGTLTVYPADMAVGAVALSIWNESKGEWEPLPSSPIPVNPVDEAGAYVTSGNTIRMKIEAQARAEYAWPGIGWEREVR